MNTQTVAVIIALIGLIVSIVTLSLTQLRPARISTLLGPNVYMTYPIEGGFSLGLPVSFTNQGARNATVLRTAVTIYRLERPDQRYFMQWNAFMKLDVQAGLRWVHDEMAHPLIIPGQSTIAKFILFGWNTEPSVPFSEGRYELVFHYWNVADGHPQSETHQIVVDRSTLETLQDTGDATKARITVSVQLGQQLRPNILMNEQEYRHLLG
jgi:hypothetical protein